jgi:lipoic acid synthetase
VNLLTIGQYLAPSKRHHPVISYPTPDEFTSYEVKGLEMGFAAVASAPLVRSSYKAETMHQKALVARKK